MGGQPDWRLSSVLLFRLWGMRIAYLAKEYHDAYLVKRVVNNRLSISVRYSRKEIPYSRVGLLVDVFLLLRNGLRLAWLRLGITIWVVPKRLTGLVDNRLPNVVASPVEVQAEILGEDTIRRLWPLLDTCPILGSQSATNSTNRDDEDHSSLFARYLLACCC